MRKEKKTLKQFDEALAGFYSFVTALNLIVYPMADILGLGRFSEGAGTFFSIVFGFLVSLCIDIRMFGFMGIVIDTKDTLHKIEEKSYIIKRTFSCDDSDLYFVKNNAPV